MVLSARTVDEMHSVRPKYCTRLAPILRRCRKWMHGPTPSRSSTLSTYWPKSSMPTRSLGPRSEFLARIRECGAEPVADRRNLPLRDIAARRRAARGGGYPSPTLRELGSFSRVALGPATRRAPRAGDPISGRARTPVGVRRRRGRGRRSQRVVAAGARGANPRAGRWSVAYTADGCLETAATPPRPCLRSPPQGRRRLGSCR